MYAIKFEQNAAPEKLQHCLQIKIHKNAKKELDRNVYHIKLCTN